MGLCVLVATPRPDKTKYIADSLRELEGEYELEILLASNRYELNEKTSRHLPDLVILDSALDSVGMLTLADEVMLHYPMVHLIVTGRRAELEKLDLMSVNKLDFFVSEPLRIKLLLLYVKKSIQAIEKERILSGQIKYWRISGQIFLDHGRITDPKNHLSVDLVNEMFGFSFRDDAYRMIVINIDNIRNSISVPPQDRFDKLLETCSDSLYHHIVPHCHESVLRISKKRIHMLINYPAKNDSLLIAKLEGWLRSLPRFITGNHYVSLCSSKLHSSIQDIGDMAEESVDAAWLRFANKSDCLITVEGDSLWPDFISQYLSRLESELRRAVDKLDIELFEAKLTELFAVPDRYFAQVKTRYAMRRIENYFYAANRYLFASISNYEETKQKMIKTVQRANSLEEYKLNYANSLLSLFRLLLSQTGAQQSKHVRLAKQYVLTNLELPLQLKDVAAVVGLNPAYLSACFKKETGCNFTDYVNQCRVEQAKMLLATGNAKISEIAKRFGYNNPRYFSSVFRKFTGMRPGEYRNSLPRPEHSRELQV